MKTLLLLMVLFAQILAQAPQQRTMPRRSPRGSAPHSATLNWTNSSCTTNTPCQIQVYRALCSSSTSCPSYPGSGFAAPPSASLTVTASAGASSTSWKVVDADPALADNATYVWVATNSFTSSPTNYSNASAPWSGTTAAAPPAVPAAPTTGSGNTIQ